MTSEAKWHIDYIEADDLGPQDWIIYYGTAESYAEQMRLSPRYQEGYWPEKAGVLSLPAYDQDNAEEIRDYLNALEARVETLQRERDEARELAVNLHGWAELADLVGTRGPAGSAKIRKQREEEERQYMADMEAGERLRAALVPTPSTDVEGKAHR